MLPGVKCPECRTTFRGQHISRHHPYCSLKCRKVSGTYIPKHKVYKRLRITMGQYSAILERAHARCEVCQRRDQKLCVDHDHTTGRVRGLLCNGCNIGLAMQSDQDKYIQYLAHQDAYYAWFLTVSG